MHAAIYAVTSLLPVAIWFLRLYTSTSKVGGKRFQLDWSIISNFWQSIREEFKVLRTWLPYFSIYDNQTLDRAIVIGALVLSIALLVYLAVALIRKKMKPSGETYKLVLLVIINLCAYLLFIALTHTITIPQIDIINRMLAPILPMLFILILAAVGLFVQHRRMLLVVFTAALLLVTLRFNFYQSSSFIAEMNENGHGYANREYSQSGIIAQIQAIPDDQRMVSNAAAFVLYYTNRFPIQVDQFANRTFGKTNGYGEKWVREKGAALIILYPEFRNFYGKAAESLLETVTQGLDAAYQDETGGIYYYPESISD
jgi:hypothetical protein